MYNVKTVGGEILNLDGALELDAANKLASEIESERDIAVRVVEQEEIDAGNFSDFLPLDYAVSLASGLSNVTTESGVVGTLVNWCLERGYHVSREVCCEVIWAQIECSTQLGCE